MKSKAFTIALLSCSIALLHVSCEKVEPLGRKPDARRVSAAGGARTGAVSGIDASKLVGKAASLARIDGYSEYLKQIAALRAAGAVKPSECGPTPFYAFIGGYFNALTPFELALFEEYATINFLSTYVDETKPYFGAQGEYTNLVVSGQRNLESFWNMPGEVVIRGQHNRTLNDRDKLAQVFLAFDFPTPTREEAYATADRMLAANKLAPGLLASPLLSLDAFAAPGGDYVAGGKDLIVIGDGVVQLGTDLGATPAVSVTGVVSHEWGHQIQFNNHQEWYGGPFLDARRRAELSRKRELEADVFSSYFMTHKRGTAYNWKSAAQYFTLFFNIGDCNFTSTGHHGTPNQRLAAARLGWLIAQETLPKGHILSAGEVHALFLAALDDIIDNTIPSADALARLPNPSLKALYNRLLKHEPELKRIASGEIAITAVANL